MWKEPRPASFIAPEPGLNGTKTPPLPVSSHVWLEMSQGAGLVRYWLAGVFAKRRKKMREITEKTNKRAGNV